MKIEFSKRAEKGYKKLPRKLQLKADRQLAYLINNYRHPSLRARKMGGSNIFEARIDMHYRFTFQIEEEEIHILTLGPHDEGLGKK